MCDGELRSRSGGAAVSAELSRLSSLTRADSTSAQQIASLRDFSSNPFTHISGIVVRQIRGGNYLALDMSVLGNYSISSLAALCCLTAEQVYSAIMRYQSNREVVRFIYEQEVGGSYPGYTVASRQLQSLGQVTSATNIGTGGRIVTSLSYTQWQLTVDLRVALILPMSDRFRDQIVHHRLQGQRQEFQPTVRRARDQISAINRLRDIIEGYIQRRKRALEPYSQGLGAIATAKKILIAMLDHPHADASPDPEDTQDVRHLLDDVITLENRAAQDLMGNPPGEAGNLIQLESSHARALRLHLESDEVIRTAQALRDNPHLVTDDIYLRYCQSVGRAYGVLMATDERDYILENILLPLIEALGEEGASSSAPVINFTAPTVVGPLISGLGIIPSAAGNLPGPPSLAVALLEAGGPALLGYAVEHPNLALRLSDRITRTIIRVTNIPDEEATQLLAAVRGGNMVEARSLLSTRFMSSPYWGALLGAINIAILIYAIQESEADTVTRWSAIVGSAAGTILSLHLLASMLRSYRVSMAAGLIRGTIGKSLGVVAGIAAVVSGVYSAQQEASTGDQRGMWLNLAGAGGAALSVAGFLIGGGIGSGATGVGAPVGLVLIIVGTIIAIAAGIALLWRELTTAGSHRVFEAYINHLEREDGAFYRVITMLDPQHPGTALYWQLRSAYYRVRNSHHNMDFWDVSPIILEALYDMIPNHEIVATIVDLDEDEVRRRVPGE